MKKVLKKFNFILCAGFIKNRSDDNNDNTDLTIEEVIKRYEELCSR